MPLFDESDFDAIRADRIARYPFPGLFIQGNPKPFTFLVRWAGEANEEWQAGAKMLHLKTMSEDDSTKAWDALAARTVIVGWLNGPVDKATGNPVPYSPDGGLEALTLIRSRKRSSMANRLTLYASDGDNFTVRAVDHGDLGNE